MDEVVEDEVVAFDVDSKDADKEDPVAVSSVYAVLASISARAPAPPITCSRFNAALKFVCCCFCWKEEEEVVSRLPRVELEYHHHLLLH